MVPGWVRRVTSGCGSPGSSSEEEEEEEVLSDEQESVEEEELSGELADGEDVPEAVEEEDEEVVPDAQETKRGKPRHAKRKNANNRMNISISHFQLIALRATGLPRVGKGTYDAVYMKDIFIFSCFS